jgi:hypothetical protein
MLCRALRPCFVVVAVAAVIGGAQAGAVTQTRPLRDASFTTAVPARWHERMVQRGGVRTYLFNSGRGHADSLGLAGPGQAALTVSRLPRSKAPSANSARAALYKVVGIPRGASRIKNTQPVRDTALGGAQAVTIQYAYTFRGARNVQTDLVALHRDSIAMVEINAPPPRATVARHALAAVISAWRWR